MALRTAQNMTEAYDAKYLDAQYQGALAATEAQAKSDYAAFANDWVTKRDLVVDELNAAGVYPIAWGGYLAFASLVWKATGYAAGLALEELCVVLIAEWVARGLSNTVLTDIRTNVFNVGAPPGP